jgi:hypothetical protein
MMILFDSIQDVVIYVGGDRRLLVIAPILRSLPIYALIEVQESYESLISARVIRV